MEWINGIARAAGGLLGAAIPWFRQLLAERNSTASGGEAPWIADSILDGALRRLGSSEPADPWWQQAAVLMPASLVRPEEFRKPYAQSWLGQADVRRLLKESALRLHRGESVEPDTHEVLVASLMSKGGESRQHANSFVQLAIAFLRMGLRERMRDPGLSEQLEHSSRVLGGQISDIKSLVDERVGRRSLPTQTADAERVLDHILRRRLAIGQRTQEELEQLWGDLGSTGRFADADEGVRLEVLGWLFRTAASRKDASRSKWRDELERRGGALSPVLHAFDRFASGETDKALDLLAQLDSAEGNSIAFVFQIARDGAKSVVERYLSVQTGFNEAFFTAFGWRNFIGALISEGKFGEAERLIRRLSDSVKAECPDLWLQHGILVVTGLVPAERREALVENGLLLLADEYIATRDADRLIDEALSCFRACAEEAAKVEAQSLVDHCSVWARALRLLDNRTRAQEIAEVQREMADPSTAIKLVALACRFRVPFDKDGVNSHLARRMVLNGRLAPAELEARFELLRATGPSAEFANFIKEEFTSLSEAAGEGPVAASLIAALVDAGETTQAEEVLDQHREVLGEDFNRLMLAIERSRGGDPTKGAIDLYRQNGTLTDLLNVVSTLKAAGRWGDLVPFGRELWERKSDEASAELYVGALLKSGHQPRLILEFLRDAEKTISLSSSLLAQKAWSMYMAGDHQGAREVNQAVRSRRTDINDFGLAINIAVHTGDWERFPEFLNEARSMAGDLPAAILLTVARIAGSTSPVDSLSLAREAIAKEPEDPRVLVAAYGIGVAAGMERQASPWLQKAAALSGGDGPVSSFSGEQLIAFIRENNEEWRKKNESFRRGELPLHLASRILNVSLFRILSAIPRSNRTQADVRRRLPIPVFGGNRRPREVAEFRRLAVDATSLILLSELGLLTLVLSEFQVLIAPSLFAFLLTERQSALFHQPSRIEAAKDFLSWMHKGKIQVAPEAPTSDLSDEVGEDTASLLVAATANEGLLIHAGPINKAGSFGEQPAAIGTLSDLVKQPYELPLWLMEAGHQGTADRDSQLEALKAMGSAGEGCNLDSAKVWKGLFVDRNAVDQIRESGLLEALIRSGVPLYVHQNTTSEWHQLVDVEPESRATVTHLEELRRTLRTALESGRVTFLPRTEDDSEGSGIGGTGIEDVIRAVHLADAVLVDDRFINSSDSVQQESFERPLICTLDVIEHLAMKALISAGRRRDLYHQLRERTCFCVPVLEEDIKAMLQEAGTGDEVRETAELRVLRQYLARLHSAEVLVTAADRVYLGQTWGAAMSVIAHLWGSSETAVERAAVWSTWIYTYVVPRVEASRALLDSEGMKQMQADRLTAAFLMSFQLPAERQASYREWLEEAFVAPLIPNDTEAIESCAARLRRVAIGVES